MKHGNLGDGDIRDEVDPDRDEVHLDRGSGGSHPPAANLAEEELRRGGDDGEARGRPGTTGSCPARPDLDMKFWIRLTFYPENPNILLMFIAS